MPSERLPTCLASVPFLLSRPEVMVQVANHSDEPYSLQRPWEIGTIETTSIETAELVQAVHNLGLGGGGREYPIAPPGAATPLLRHVFAT